MRKESMEIVRAFIAGTPKKMKRTYTDGLAIYLHGNKIAEKRQDGVYGTLVGWGTTTTRERLNCLTRELTGRARFCQRKNEQYFDGDEIDSREWVLLKGVGQ